MNEIKSVENKINELALSVIPSEHVNSFLDLPLKEKVFGIKFFATLSNDTQIIKMCEYAETIV